MPTDSRPCPQGKLARRRRAFFGPHRSPAFCGTDGDDAEDRGMEVLRTKRFEIAVLARRIKALLQPLRR